MSRNIILKKINFNRSFSN